MRADPGDHVVSIDTANTNSTVELRTEAEAKVAAQAVATDSLNDQDVKRLYHELQIHQVELEMQNEALRLTKLDLEATRDSYFDLYDLAPVGYLTLNNDGLIRRSNLTAVTMLGVERGALINQQIQKFIFRDDIDFYYLQSRSAIEASEDFKLELRFVQSDGTPFWVNLQVTPQNDDELWLTFSDIGDRKQLEQSLRQANDTLEEQVTERTEELATSVTRLEQGIADRQKLGEQLQKSENQYRTLFEMMDEGFCVVDLIYDSNDKPVDFRFLEINPAFIKQTGLHQALGKTMRQFVPDFEDFWFETYDEVIRTGEPKRFENHSVAMERFYDVFAFRIIEAGTLRVGILFNDISNRKKAESEKVALEYRLNQSQKMEAIGQLAGGVAHDFNNKLMAILGNAELAKMDIHDSDKVIHYLNEIRRAAEHSRDITYRLLAFSRQQVVTPQVLDANKIIADSLKSLSRLIGEHVSISFAPCDTIWNIRMDPVQLDQVVMNLATNARDAMPDGGSLLIETRNTSYVINSSSGIDAVPGDYVMVTFRDTGTGMDEKMVNHIFEPFFTTKEVGKGTGLGLATIYGIIRQSSGFIDVSSNIGFGTEFRVYIPRFSASKTEPAKTADTLCTGSCSILLVEDEDAVRNVTSLFLRKIGYTVHEAATPRAALELARDPSIRIDLVLTDFLMPEMNGRVMMEQILELRPQMQCIYASGFSTDHVLLSEDAHFIQKPYDFTKLSVFLKRVLSNVREDV